MGSTPIGTGLHCPVTLLFSRSIRIPRINKDQINFNADDEHCEALMTCQDKYIQGNDTNKDSFSLPIGLTVVVQCEDGGPWTHGIVKETNGTDHQRMSYIISDENWRANNTQHEKLTRYTNNNWAVTLGTK